MYSGEKNVQITLSLLKAKNIKYVVLSPGGSDAPVVKSFENDDFFKCYSIVDERSSVFFGIGLAQELKQPVVCVCTSGTAVSNFLTGMTEAFYQNVPIIAITTDSHAYNLNQLELQKLNQNDIFRDVTRAEITLPAINDEMDEWHCNRIINEALLEMNHHGTGPIHINIPITKTLSCDAKTLPVQRVINRHYIENTSFEILSKRLIGKKILFIVGQNTVLTPDSINIFNKIFQRYNCIYNIETVSNLKCDGCVITYPLTESFMAYDKQKLIPDIVISLGNFVASYMLKPLLRSKREDMENWLVSPTGDVRDPYWSLNEIFEGDVMDFMRSLLAIDVPDNNDHSYFKSWTSVAMNFKIDNLGFSSLSIAKLLSEMLPDNSVLHTAILNSTRIMQFFPPKKNVTCYTNLGALGIDGCAATAVGHSMASDKLTYLLTGDLSFFYGMNALGIRGIKNNLRVILLNNGGGEEFKIKLGLPNLNNYVCACSNHRVAKGWVKSLGFEYYNANTNEEVAHVLERFAKTSDNPLFLELFIDIDKDAEIIRNIYADNKPALSIKDILKKGLVKLLPEEVINQLKTLVK